MFTSMFLPAFTGSDVRNEPIVNKPQIYISCSVATSSETPAPMDLGPCGIYVASTGQIILMQSPADLVKTSAQYMKSVAILPIDEHDDAVVDSIVSRKLSDIAAKPLTRRI